jgi:hypothetical protein
MRRMKWIMCLRCWSERLGDEPFKRHGYSEKTSMKMDFF